MACELTAPTGTEKMPTAKHLDRNKRVQALHASVKLAMHASSSKLCVHIHIYKDLLTCTYTYRHIRMIYRMHACRIRYTRTDMCDMYSKRQACTACWSSDCQLRGGGLGHLHFLPRKVALQGCATAAAFQPPFLCLCIPKSQTLHPTLIRKRSSTSSQL